MTALLFLLPLVLLWVLFVRPQQRRMRQTQAMVASLEEGDEVITTGGIYGTITDTDDTSLWLEVAPDVIVRVLRGAVAQRVPTDLDDLVAHDQDDDEDDEDDEEDDGDEPGGHDGVDHGGRVVDADPTAAATPGSNGHAAGVANGTTAGPPLPEPTTGDDEA